MNSAPGVAEQPRDGHVVLFVDPAGLPSPEADAALAWLRGLPGLVVLAVRLRDVPEALLGYRSTLWFHSTDPPKLQSAERLAIDAHVRAGGGLLATLAAASLPVQLGWEDVSPDEHTDATWSEEPVDELSSGFSERRSMRGLQSFRGHPLFDGLASGAYTWRPEEGERFVRCAYTGNRWPSQGRVIAVEKSLISMNPGRRLAWEYMVGDGWAVCIGGYLYFSSVDATYRPHLQRVVENSLRRVAANGHRLRAMGGAWKPPGPGLQLDDRVPLPPALGDVQIEPASGRQLERDATDAEYTLAGARALVVGRERTGPEEIWFHPNRAIARWSLTVDTDGDRAVQVVASHFGVSPNRVERRLEVAGHTVLERTSVDGERPTVLVELRPEDSPIRLVLTLESDLRLMWPYPPNSAGRLSYAQQAGAVGVSSETGDWLGVRIEPVPETLEVEDASDEERSRFRLRARLSLSEATRLALVGATPQDPSVDTVSIQHKPLSDNKMTHIGEVSTNGETAELLQEALRWATYRLASYRVHVPGLGTCLAAGYGRSGEGAFGDGRPGYAWFFGRDACWTGLACLGVGQFEVVRETLQFLGRHQDITGKIFHECTTSGVVHYDSADSTPLYLLLAARYLTATGESEVVEEEWPHIVRAYEYCLSTDSDGDGLIENTGVGHGWVEFGPLGEHHVSLYLAAVWVAALTELEAAARRLGKREFGDELGYRSAAARASLELSFFDPIEGRYATGRRADGSLNMRETVMTAVPLWLGAVTPERCQGWLDRVASEDFTAEWGVRLSPRSELSYEPDGYHSGSVWPLFTGWVSLAEYIAGRLDSADRHWRQVARLYKANALGAWPEVLHGEELRSIGVTSDQAWSTAMALLPWLSRSSAGR
jgi:hypothetical protein